MTAYTVKYTNQNKEISIMERTVDTSTDISLVGRDYENYGQIIATNFLHMLENFANDDPPAKPIEGQLWYDTDDDKLNYYDGINFKEICSLTAKDEQPQTQIGEEDGHMWLNTDNGHLWMYYNGSWRFIIDLGEAGEQNRLVFRTRRDTDEIEHRTAEMIVNDQIVFIVNSDVEKNDDDELVPWEPLYDDTNYPAEYLEDGTTLLNTEFAEIKPGINLRGGDESDFGFHGTATSARYKDLAERYHADQYYEHGTVVEIGGINEITQTKKRGSTDVFGVISTNPALMMNSNAGNNETHPYVALAGRVPIKVIGRVSKGDRLVSSNIPGHAESNSLVTNYEKVIGRSLENKFNDESGIIEAVVGAK